jgi:hypothetical protein
MEPEAVAVPLATTDPPRVTLPDTAGTMVEADPPRLIDPLAVGRA